MVKRQPAVKSSECADGDGQAVRLAPPRAKPRRPSEVPPAAGTPDIPEPKPKPKPKPKAPRPRRKRRSKRQQSKRWKDLRQRLTGWTSGVRRAWRYLNVLPPAIRTLLITSLALCLFALTNIVYQVVKKPTEMFFPVSRSLNKMPSATWAEYAPLFRQYSTAIITPDLLAALAQIEAAGNPVARTYWRWRLTLDPFGIYKPASSAVGMYQMTDGAFADARHYCIRHHTVVEEGDWGDWDSCWFNGLYARVLPGNAIELTAVSLDRAVGAILSHHRGKPASLQQMQDTAVLAHLCGAGPARAFARRGFRLLPGERCGDHEAAVYLAKANTMKRLFAKMAAEGQ